MVASAIIKHFAACRHEFGWADPKLRSYSLG
jgi:hypothetical protein